MKVVVFLLNKAGERAAQLVEEIIFCKIVVRTNSLHKFYKEKY